MLPGKKYTPEELLRIAWTRKWLIVVPTALIAASTFVVSQYLPDQFRSEARIQIVPQRVPEKFVQSTVTTQLDDRLQAVSQQILSRPRLERIIQDLNLYAEERKTMVMEDVIERMRRDVNITIDRPRNRREDPAYFLVSYRSNDAQTALHVTERFGSLIISENLQDREVLAELTSQFLRTQLDESKQRLIEHEQKLAAYREAHMGELPTQVQSNLQVMQSTQTQLQAGSDAINRDHDRQLALDQMIADADSLSIVPESPTTREPVDRVRRGSAADQLNAARVNLENLELRLTSAHPDVQRAKRLIEELEKKAEAESLETSLAADGTAPSTISRADVARQSRLSEMRAERAMLDRKIEQARAQQTRLERVIATYRARIEVAPTRESELAELTRDYQTIQDSYNALLTKSQASDISANLERQQIGEQFRIIDPARLPEKPVSPNRLRINALGALGGLALSLALVAFLEYRDTTLKSDVDVLTALALPVLAVIPRMVTTWERRRTTRRRLLAIGATCVVAVSAVAVAAWKLRLLESWVR